MVSRPDLLTPDLSARSFTLLISYSHTLWAYEDGSKYIENTYILYYFKYWGCSYLAFNVQTDTNYAFSNPLLLFFNIWVALNFLSIHKYWAFIIYYIYKTLPFTLSTKRWSLSLKLYFKTQLCSSNYFFQFIWTLKIKQLWLQSNKEGILTATTLVSSALSIVSWEILL